MEIKAEEISQIIKDQIKGFDADVDLSETGVVLSAGDGIARVYGLEKVKAMELVEFPGGILFPRRSVDHEIEQDLIELAGQAGHER